MRITIFSFDLLLVKSIMQLACFSFGLQLGAYECVAPAQSRHVGQNLSETIIVEQQPFSAVKFSRRLHLTKEGVTQTTEEKGHALLARDTEGRIFLSGVQSFDEHCDLPNLGKLPRCAFWHTLLFDPSAGLMWHWCEGDSCDKTQYLKIDLQSEQIAEAERLTSALAESPRNDPNSGITVLDLGEHIFEGIRAKGVRITTTQQRGSSKPNIKIHEVWTSAPMRLVLRVVDANSEGEMTESGLEHISLSPDAALFRPPTERILRNWKNGSDYAQPDLEHLAMWLVH